MRVEWSDLASDELDELMRYISRDSVFYARRFGEKVTYPRERGGTWAAAKAAQEEKGLSPRARGNLQGRQNGGEKRGPIPASAGEPRIVSRQT